MLEVLVEKMRFLAREVSDSFLEDQVALGVQILMEEVEVSTSLEEGESFLKVEEVQLMVSPQV